MFYKKSFRYFSDLHILYRLAIKLRFPLKQVWYHNIEVEYPLRPQCHPVNDLGNPVPAHRASKLCLPNRMLLQEEVLDAELSILSLLPDDVDRIRNARRGGIDRH